MDTFDTTSTTTVVAPSSRNTTMLLGAPAAFVAVDLSHKEEPRHHNLFYHPHHLVVGNNSNNHNVNDGDNDDVNTYTISPVATTISNNNASVMNNSDMLSTGHSTPNMPTPQVSPPSSHATAATSAAALVCRQAGPPTIGSHQDEKKKAAVLSHIRQILNATTASPNAPASPTCSVATQTAELLGDWSDDTAGVDPFRKDLLHSSSHASPSSISENTATATLFAMDGSVTDCCAHTNRCSVGTGTSSFADVILEGTIAVIMTLVLKGDQHWETSNPRRCKTTSAKTNIQHTITGIIVALRASGLLRDEVAIAMVVYLRRLSAKHVKYVSRFTIKKYLVASCMVANKTCSDCYYCLDDYVLVVGMAKSCVAEAEIQFLTNIEYDVQIGIHYDSTVPFFTGSTPAAEAQTPQFPLEEETHHQQQQHQVLPAPVVVAAYHAPPAISFFQTSVLIHDMAMAAAAVVATLHAAAVAEAEAEAAAAALETEAEVDAPTTTESSTDTVEVPSHLPDITHSSPVEEDETTVVATDTPLYVAHSGASAVATASIVSIVEGILANAEAMI